MFFSCTNSIVGTHFSRAYATPLHCCASLSNLEKYDKRRGSEWEEWKIYQRKWKIHTEWEKAIVSTLQSFYSRSFLLRNCKCPVQESDDVESGAWIIENGCYDRATAAQQNLILYARHLPFALHCSWNICIEMWQEWDMSEKDDGRAFLVYYIQFRVEVECKMRKRRI